MKVRVRYEVPVVDWFGNGHQMCQDMVCADDGGEELGKRLIELMTSNANVVNIEMVNREVRKNG